MPTYCSPCGRISEVTEHQGRDVLLRAKESFYNLSARLVVFHTHTGSRVSFRSLLVSCPEVWPCSGPLRPSLGLFLATTWDPLLNRIQIPLLGTPPYASLANIHPVLISLGPLWLHPGLGGENHKVLMFSNDFKKSDHTLCSSLSPNVLTMTPVCWLRVEYTTCPFVAHLPGSLVSSLGPVVPLPPSDLHTPPLPHFLLTQLQPRPGSVCWDSRKRKVARHP